MFFKNNLEENQNENFIKISALLIHAAKIDQEYSAKEEEIIKETLLKIGAEKNDLEKIISEAKKIEENSNQILNFTKEVKGMAEENKIKIIEALWHMYGSSSQQSVPL